MASYTVRIPAVGKAFLAVVAVDILVLIACSIAVIASNPPFGSIFYSVLVMITSLFLTYFAADAVIQENSFQLSAFIVISLLLVLELVYHFVFDSVGRDSQKNASAVVNGLVEASLIVGMLGQMVFLGLWYFVFKSFGWRLFKRVGANAAFVSMFRQYQSFLSVLKIDVQFMINIVLLAGFFLEFQWALGVIIAVLLMTIVLSYGVVDFGIKQERKDIVLVFLGFSLLAPGYIIYKIIVIENDTSSIRNVSGAGSATTVRSVLVTLGMLAVLCRLACLSLCVVVMRNFGRGLRNLVFDKEQTLVDKLKDGIRGLYGPEQSAAGAATAGSFESTAPYSRYA